MPPGVDAQRPAYGIDEDVQRALSELRTDLDAFSDDEAYSLMAAGYKMTEVELAEALPESRPHGHARQGRRRGHSRRALLEVAEPDAQSGLAAELQPGSSRFFRGLRAWRLRRARRPKGWLGRQLDRDRPAGRAR